MEISDAKKKELLVFALGLADKSRALITEKMSSGFKIGEKDDGSLVTEVDRGVEELLRKEIEGKYPEHGIWGEEFGKVREDAEYQWILDPIDGTIAFTHGLPFFGTLIGLEKDGESLLGVVDLPGLGRRYWASVGEGAFVNGQKFEIGSCDDVEAELIAVCDRLCFKRAGADEGWQRIMEDNDRVRNVSDCAAHMLAAQGSFGALVDYDLNKYDIAAIKPIVEEAGGVWQVQAREVEGVTKYDVICGKKECVQWCAERFN